MPTEINIEIEDVEGHPDAKIIKFNGALDATNIEGVSKTITSLIDNGHPNLIADFTKYPKELTSFPVPIEIIEIAINTVIEPIFNLGGEFKLRYGTGKHGPIITDNGNLIGDITFKEDFNPFEMEKELNNIPGIIENGLFPYGANKVIIGHEETVEIIVRNPLVKEEQL